MMMFHVWHELLTIPQRIATKGPKVEPKFLWLPLQPHTFGPRRVIRILRDGVDPQVTVWVSWPGMIWGYPNRGTPIWLETSGFSWQFSNRTLFLSLFCARSERSRYGTGAGFFRVAWSGHLKLGQAGWIWPHLGAFVLLEYLNFPPGLSTASCIHLVSISKPPTSSLNNVLHSFSFSI